jgi:hypothetical protein
MGLNQLAHAMRLSIRSRFADSQNADASKAVAKNQSTEIGVDGDDDPRFGGGSLKQHPITWITGLLQR